MSHKPLRWGLLSTARINRVLIPAIRASKRSELVAVASRSQSQAETFAREWGLPHAFGSYQSLLDDPDIDVIYNPLPNHLHAEWSILAMQAGKHVLCEKPLALTVEEVDRMAATAKTTGQVLAEAFMYRHHPQTLKARELVAEGRLGEVRALRSAFTFTLNRPSDIRWNKAMGGGSLWDVGCYPVGFMRYLIDSEPLEVFGWQVPGPGECDATFAGQMRFPENILAQFDCGFQAPLRTELEVVGSTGTLTIPLPFKPGRRGQLFLREKNRTETIHTPGEDLYQGEVEDMADAILLGRPARVSLADSRGNIAAIQALLSSAQSGMPVLV